MALVLQVAASLERYSKHPLARPILTAQRRAGSCPRSTRARSASARAKVSRATSKDGMCASSAAVRPRRRGTAALCRRSRPASSASILLDGRYAATYRFHDAPRADSRSFITHLRPRHQLDRILLVSGDRESEVRYLADRVGIDEVYAGQTPEQKVAITREETRRAPTLFIGDGINDAPALVTATVGLAFGHQSEITTEAAGAVIMDTSLKRVDELFHLARRMRRIALQSAVGGMALSVVGMFIAFGGWLPPVGGAVFQEVIDLAAVLNALARRRSWRRAERLLTIRNEGAAMARRPFARSESVVAPPPDDESRAGRLARSRTLIKDLEAPPGFEPGMEVLQIDITAPRSR